jgi:hypothetical protein
MTKAKVETTEQAAPTSGLTSGRIVHYVDLDGNHRAAVITHVPSPDDWHVNLFVFPDGDFPYDLPTRNGATPVNVMFDEGTKPPRSWHWIERA